MRKGAFAGGLALALLGAGAAVAENACYLVGEPEGETFVRWDVELQGRLSTPTEQRRFGNPVMGTHTVHGIFTSTFLPDLPVVPIHGTVTVARGVGASFALHGPALLSVGQFMSLDCKSEEASPTPSKFTCQFFAIDANTQEIFDPLVVEFTKVNPLQNPVCSLFVPADLGS